MEYFLELTTEAPPQLTALLVDLDKGKMASYSVPMPKQTPRKGWVEHNPDDFFTTSLNAARGALDKANLSWKDVQAMGLANQGETSIAWSSKSGKSIGPAISWEDKRTTEICQQLDNNGVSQLVRERTGILLDPYFSASKFRWLLDHVPEIASAAKNRTLRLGGTDSYVIDKLTRSDVHAIDAGTASRTSLFNLFETKWDGELLKAFGLEEDFLPKIRPTCGDFGLATHADLGGASIPISADAVDAHAALFSQGCRDNSKVKATYGTGAFIEINTGPNPVKPDGLLPVFVAWQIDGQTDYTVEGGVFSVGSAIDWFVNTGLLPSAAASSDLAESVLNAGGVKMLPCFTGLSAPHWQTDTRASIQGLGLDTEPGHIARALLDGIAFQCGEIVHALDKKTGGNVREVRADGGLTKNHYLMQRQADLLAMPISVSQEPDMTALGAAYLAAIGAGGLAQNEIDAISRTSVEYEPMVGEDERQSNWASWNQFVKETIDSANSQ